MTEEKKRTGYPSIDKPWLKYYTDEAVSAPLPECTMYELLWNSNKDHPEDIALHYYGKRITYGQLFREIEKAAKAFSALGVRRGEIVLLCAINTPEMVYALYALDRLGAVANMVDPRTTEQGLREYALESATRFVVTIDVAYPAFVRVARELPIEKIVVLSPADSLPPVAKGLYRLKAKPPRLGADTLSWKALLALGAQAEPQYPAYQRDTCCVMSHTGGTTGLPKSVMLSNDNINAVTHSYRYLGIPFQRKQRFFCDLPPFVMYGLCISLHTTLVYGLEVILYPVFDSRDFPRQFARYKPHHFTSVVQHLKYLSEDRRTRHMDLSWFITAGAGGDSISRELEARSNAYLRANHCPFDMQKGYGMTELTATAATSCPRANALGSVGIPLVHNTVKLVDPDTRQELPYGQTGEIWVSGPSIMLGYYQKPEETAELMVTDEAGTRWVRTGDLGHMDADGLLFHEGRIRRVYPTVLQGSPAKIFPVLVESFLQQSPAVLECSVVGRMRDEKTMYEAVAFVVKKDAAQDNAQLVEELKGLCRENVASYMHPVEYRFVDALPRTPIGKVDFRALEQLAEEMI